MILSAGIQLLQFIVNLLALLKPQVTLEQLWIVWMIRKFKIFPVLSSLGPCFYCYTDHWCLQQIHRRKVRAWQMICVLSRFVDDDIVGRVTSSLHIALYVSVAKLHITSAILFHNKFLYYKIVKFHFVTENFCMLPTYC